MSAYIQEVLSKLGWQDGFQIPVANQENRDLEAEVARLTLLKIKSKAKCENDGHKLENLNGHLKHVKQELEENQKLMTAYEHQVKGEENRLLLSKADQNNVEQESRKIGKTISETSQRIEARKTNLEKGVAKMEKLKAETSWDAEALIAWKESLKKRNDDNELMKRISKEDERKFNELESKRQNLEVEYNYRKQTIEKMVGDVLNFETILEQTGKAVKQQIAERDALIQQWKSATQNLQQRDNNIEQLQQTIIEFHENLAKHSEKLKEHQNFYEKETQNNANLKTEINQIREVVARKRKEIFEFLIDFNLYKQELETLRRLQNGTISRLEKARSDQRRDVEELNKKQEKIKWFNEVELVRMKERLDSLTKHVLTATDRERHLEQLIDVEEKFSRTIQMEIEAMQTSWYMQLQELQEHQNETKSKESLLTSLGRAIVYTRKSNVHGKKDTEIREELVCDLNYKIDMAQRKILESETVKVEDKTESDKKIINLEQNWTEMKETESIMKVQVNKIREEMHRITSEIAADEIRLGNLKEKLQQQLKTLEGGQKQMQLSKGQYQAKQVEENMLRLRVEQMDKTAKREERNISDINKFRLNLEQAMLERMLEIKTDRDVLMVKRRTLTDDRGRLKLDMGERKIKLDQYRKRYDSVLMLLGLDEFGKPYSVTHFKIKNAQEKFMLQQDGDELDGKIRKAEKEIVAMENTLKVLNATNTAFKQSLGLIADDEQEISEKQMLDGKIASLTNSLRNLKQELIKKQKELKEIEEKTTNYIEEKHGEIETFKILKEQCNELRSDYLGKKEMIEKIEANINSVAKKLGNVKEKEKYERDFEIRLIKDANFDTIFKLNKLSNEYHEVKPLVVRYFSEYGLKLSDLTQKQRSISSGSSSTKSTKSVRSSTTSSIASSNVSHLFKTQTRRQSKTSMGKKSSSSQIAKVDISFNL